VFILGKAFSIALISQLQHLRGLNSSFKDGTLFALHFSVHPVDLGNLSLISYKPTNALVESQVFMMIWVVLF